MPALATRASRGPSQASQKARTEARSARSSATTRVPGNSLTSASAEAGFRVAMVTCAPAPASARTVSTPRPEEPPVTIIRRPLRSTPSSTSAAVARFPNVVVVSDIVVPCLKEEWLLLGRRVAHSASARTSCTRNHTTCSDMDSGVRAGRRSVTLSKEDRRVSRTGGWAAGRVRGRTDPVPGGPRLSGPRATAPTGVAMRQSALTAVPARTGPRAPTWTRRSARASAHSRGGLPVQGRPSHPGHRPTWQPTTGRAGLHDGPPKEALAFGFGPVTDHHGPDRATAFTHPLPAVPKRRARGMRGRPARAARARRGMSARAVIPSVAGTAATRRRTCVVPQPAHRRTRLLPQPLGSTDATAAHRGTRRRTLMDHQGEPSVRQGPPRTTGGVAIPRAWADNANAAPFGAAAH